MPIEDAQVIMITLKIQCIAAKRFLKVTILPQARAELSARAEI
jgi:hypothetical protein